MKEQRLNKTVGSLSRSDETQRYRGLIPVKTVEDPATNNCDNVKTSRKVYAIAMLHDIGGHYSLKLARPAHLRGIEHQFHKVSNCSRVNQPADVPDLMVLRPVH